MAVMSTLPPDAVITTQKSQTADMATPTVGEKPNGVEVNGHASPVETHPEATTETPTSKDDTPAPEPKGQDAPTSTTSDAEKLAPETAVESSDKPSADATIGKPAHASADASADAPEDAPVADVAKDSDMVDATSTPVEASAPAVEEATEEATEEDTGLTDAPTDAPTSAPPPTEDAPVTQEDTEMSGVQSGSSEAAGVNGTITGQDAAEPSAVDASFQASTTTNGVSQEESSVPATANSANTSTTDTPSQSSVKVAREREDDAFDERAAKRAKTDEDGDVPMADDVKTEGPAVDSMQVDQPVGEPAPLAVSENPQTLTDASLDDKPITSHQTRELRKILAGVKKTKNGAMFKQSVKILWPTIWEQYSQRIEKPTDISAMEQKLREGAFETLGGYKKELRSLYDNSVAFNGPVHDVTLAAKLVVEAVFGKMAEVPAEPQARPEPKEPKQIPTRHAEPRASNQQQQQQRRESRGAATSPAEKVSDSPVFAVPPSGVPIIRRDSTKNDGERPKRPIHPPKSKDLGFPPVKNLKKKKVQPDFRFCDEVLNEVKKLKYQQWNAYFLDPVDPVLLNIPTYHKVIKQPMDLGTMSEKLQSGQYESAKAFENDFNLMLKNCYKFNPPGHVVHTAGLELEKIFKEKWAEKDAWMAKHAPASSPSAAGASGRSGAGDMKDDDSDDDNDEEGHEADEEAPSSALLESLQARLKEEQKRLDDAMNAAKPDLGMVHLQQSVISMIQNQIIEEKMKVIAHDKKPASKAKASKAKKPAAAAGANAKKSAAAAPAKKSGGGSKKSAKPRKLNAEEKEVISEGIGRLEGNLLDKAIDIIKKDTKLPDTDDAELELDMEQLSDDALVRLFDMIVKAFPEYKSQLKEKHHEPEPAPRPSAGMSKTAAGKPKKNKPMGKAEQERKLEQLRELKAKYPRPGSGSQEPLPSVENGESHGAPAQDSDEDSSSEEE